jgi:hypothetical protein
MRRLATGKDPSERAVLGWIALGTTASAVRMSRKLSRSVRSAIARLLSVGHGATRMLVTTSTVEYCRVLGGSS